MELEEFDRLIAEERHNEMMATFIKIINSIPKVSNSDVIEAIEKYSAQVESLANSINQIEIPAPKVTVEKSETIINQDAVVSSIRSMQDDIMDGLLRLKDAVQKEPAEKKEVMAVWHFDVLRNDAGLIITVNAKQVK